MRSVIYIIFAIVVIASVGIALAGEDLALSVQRISFGKAEVVVDRDPNIVVKVELKLREGQQVVDGVSVTFSETLRSKLVRVLLSDFSGNTIASGEGVAEGRSLIVDVEPNVELSLVAQVKIVIP